MSKGKKVRSIRIERVKDGKGKQMHRVSVDYHSTPGKEGKGMRGAMPIYHEPEETYHTSAADAKKHVGKAMGQMTASPEDDTDGDEAAC